MNIVIKGTVGFTGISEAMTGQEALWANFPERFRARWRRLSEGLLSEKIHLPEDAVSLEEGFFQALWQLGERRRSGLTVDLDSVPIRQEIIELAQLLDLNPYRVPGRGYVAVREGAPAEGETLIGYLTSGPERVIHQRENDRYLTRPERGY